MIWTCIWVWCAFAFGVNCLDWWTDKYRREAGVLEYWRGWMSWTVLPITAIPMLLLGAKIRYKGKAIWPTSSSKN